MTWLNLYTCTCFLLRFPYDCVSSLTLIIFYIYHYNAVSGDNLIFTNGKNRCHISCAEIVAIPYFFHFTDSSFPLLSKSQNFKQQLQWLCNVVCVEPGQVSRRHVLFSHDTFIFRITILAASQESQQCGFATGMTPTELYKHRRWIEAGNFGFRKYFPCSENKGTDQLHS